MSQERELACPFRGTLPELLHAMGPLWHKVNSVEWKGFAAGTCFIDRIQSGDAPLADPKTEQMGALAYIRHDPDGLRAEAVGELDFNEYPFGDFVPDNK